MPWPPLPPWSEVVDVAERIALPAAGLAFAIPIVVRWTIGRAAIPFALPLGAAAGLALTFKLREAAPWLPEEFGSGWMHVAWAAALACGGAAAILPVRWAWLPKLAAVVNATWVTLPVERRDGPWWFICLAAAMAVPWLVFLKEGDVASRRQWPERSVWLALSLFAASIVSLHAHYLRVTDFALMAACALSAGAVARALLNRDGRELEGLGFVSLPALAMSLWNDSDSTIPAPAFLCMGLAAVPIAVFPFLPRKGWRSLLIRGALALFPAAIAVILAMSFEELSFG